MTLETGLHRARVQRGIDLTDLAARTRLSPRIIQRIDEGRFAELPGGLYARAYVRAFAAEVGLDPLEVLQDLEPVLPPVEDPIEGLREAARQAEAMEASLDGLPGRLAAAGVDAFILFALDALLIHLVAVTCRVSVGALLDQAAIAVAAVCAVPLALYFLVFDGIGGRTPGALICNLPVAPDTAPLEARTILIRAVFSGTGAAPAAAGGLRPPTHEPRPARAQLRIANDADEQLA